MPFKCCIHQRGWPESRERGSEVEINGKHAKQGEKVLGKMQRTGVYKKDQLTGK